MGSQIDRVGCYRGRITESGVGATKNGFPQFVARFLATQKYVDDKAEMATFGLTEPGWVDWSGYEQDMTGYLILAHGEKDNPGVMKQSFHVENIMKVTGWDGGSYGTLGTLDLSEKELTFWVEENEYQGNVRLQIAGIDDAEASPNRSLRSLDATGLADLDKRFAGVLVKKAAAPAKAPAKAPPAAAPKAPVAKGAAPTAAAPAPVSTAKAPPKATKMPAKGPAPFEGGMTKESAWDHILKNKGAATDDAMAEKWVDAAEAVAPGKAEEAITEEEWAAIAAKTLELLAA